MGKIWSVCSGSGGVGKTTIALSLAVGAAKGGKETILLDAAGISRACDLLLGIEGIVSLDMADVLTQQMEIGSALYPVPGCEKLRLANASLYEEIPLSELSGLLLALEAMCDILVIDLPTGGLLSCEGLASDSDECLFVLSPDDPSMRSTERLLNHTRGLRTRTSLIVNRVRKERIKRSRQYEPQTVSMTLDCPLLGSIPEEELFSLVSSSKGSMLDWNKAAQHRAIREILAQLL